VQEDYEWTLSGSETLGPPDARPKRAILTWTRRASHSSRRTDIDGNAARDGQNIARHAISDYISLKTLLWLFGDAEFNPSLSFRR
jgi:hypothetical protein